MVVLVAVLVWRKVVASLLLAQDFSNSKIMIMELHLIGVRKRVKRREMYC